LVSCTSSTCLLVVKDTNSRGSNKSKMNNSGDQTWRSTVSKAQRGKVFDVMYVFFMTYSLDSFNVYNKSAVFANVPKDKLKTYVLEQIVKIWRSSNSKVNHCYFMSFTC
jgi:hypothetical protein